jgi:hypothetical protein
MLKYLLSAVVVFSSVSSFAADCVDAKGQDIYNNPEVFTAMIKNAKSCNEATEIANACAWGSSLDVSTAGAAFNVCAKELIKQSPNKKVSELLVTMRNTCTAKYAKLQGTMYRSMNAYCHLSALEWILGVATQN